MHAQAGEFHKRHHMLQFHTPGQKALFELLTSGKRGFVLDAEENKMDIHHAGLMFMLWIYCHAMCHTGKQPRQIFYVSNSRAKANAARNLFHGIGMLCIQDPKDVVHDHKKVEKKPTFRFTLGPVVVRFLHVDCEWVFNKHVSDTTEAVIFADLCMPHWVLRLIKRPGRFVYGVTTTASSEKMQE